jgi:hypothetical protein
MRGPFRERGVCGGGGGGGGGGGARAPRGGGAGARRFPPWGVIWLVWGALSASAEFAEAPPHPGPLPLKGERERQHRARLTCVDYRNRFQTSSADSAGFAVEPAAV